MKALRFKNYNKTGEIQRNLIAISFIHIKLMRLHIFPLSRSRWAQFKPKFKKISCFYTKNMSIFGQNLIKLEKTGKKEDFLTKNMIYRIFIDIKHIPKCFLCIFKPKRYKIQHL